VDDDAILKVGSIADPNPMDISPNDHVVPDGDVITERHLTDHHRVGGHKNPLAEHRGQAGYRLNRHDGNLPIASFATCVAGGVGTLPQARSDHQCHHGLPRTQNTGNVRVVDLEAKMPDGKRLEEKEIAVNNCKQRGCF